MIMRTLLRLALCCLMLFSARLSGQEFSTQDEIIIHVRPADRSTLSVAEEQEFLSAATFGARFYEAGDFESAIQQLRVADKLLPGHPALLYNLVVVLARLGQLDDAEVKLDMYRALYPDGEEMPQIRKLQIDLEWLREVHSRAKLTQAYGELFDRGRASFESREYASAAESFRQARQANPGDVAAPFNQAIALEALGNYSGSMDVLGEVLALNSAGVNRTAVEARVDLLRAEITDQRSSILCSFCGRRLPVSGGWCPDCGHGPFIPDSPQWSSRSCAPGSSATLSTFYSTGAPYQSEPLPCMYSGSYANALQYTTPKRRAIQAARKADGWSFDGNRISTFRDGDHVIELIHDGEVLERIASPSAGDLLEHSARRLSDGRWQVDWEDRVIEGQRYRKQYAYDGMGRIVRETVRYQAANSCGQVIEVSADWRYEGERLMSVSLQGGYEGYPSEGSPRMQWRGTVAFTYDTNGFVQREDLNIDSFEKTYTKLSRNMRRDLERYYPGIRVNAPQDLLVNGDICGSAGTQRVMNLIDLRAFDAWSPNLAIALPPGVTRATVSFTHAK